MALKKSVPCKKADGRKRDEELFHLPKALKTTLRKCACEQERAEKPRVVFLWACVTEAGFKQGVKGEKPSKRPLTQQEWFTVVDEAASLGANWFVLSFKDSLASCGDIWDVCKWAQDAHGMMVGLHVTTGRLTRRDIVSISGLNLKKTRILAREGALSRLKLSDTEKKSLVVWTANPQPEGERPNCQGPTRMIFVNAQGVLYTCGLVEGNASYRMGHVLDKKMKAIMTDRRLPHHVHADLHYVTPECDGCPALIANYFSENE